MYVHTHKTKSGQVAGAGLPGDLRGAPGHRQPLRCSVNKQHFV